MPRYIVNITMPDGSDSVVLADFAYEAAEVVQTTESPLKVRRVEDAQTRQEWFGDDIEQFVKFARA
ncbi:hypothetical protein QMA67_14055 [Gluconobacter japonicus]|uniref:hypothetical protein n=1 Tax=Gluconobacter TaxID=441 RepID=UPI001B8ABBF7|nr:MULTISPECIES: hypothetical protein [Gluconobacter]MBS0995518.1 hypothetical protein [Gluconobacter cerinus]MDI6654045.1 hypothetical protein [Gluconobacter japonicus]